MTPPPQFQSDSQQKCEQREMQSRLDSLSLPTNTLRSWIQYLSTFLKEGPTGPVFLSDMGHCLQTNLVLSSFADQIQGVNASGRERRALVEGMGGRVDTGFQRKKSVYKQPIV